MRNLIFCCCCYCCCFTTPISAQDEPAIYTVIAPSGMSLREGPGQTFDRIGGVPFNTQVKVLSANIDYQKTETIDGRTAYWYPVQYGQQKGYLFSAYLKPGALFKPSQGKVDRDIRIVVPDVRFESLNFDDQLNWYALISSEEGNAGNFLLKKVSPKVDYAPEDGRGMVRIDCGLSEQWATLLIGTKKPIANPLEVVQQTYLQYFSNYFKWGRPVYPYEQVELFTSPQGNDRYALQAQEICLAASGEEATDRQYQLGIVRNAYPEGYFNGFEQDLSAELAITWEPGQKPELATNFYHHPILLWQGDINGDQMPDLLFHCPPVGESCGGSVAYVLLVSGQENGAWRWRKAAEDVIYYEGC
ncbi:MAG: hypothetical protein DA408_14110 [Bacteroidetes bacterium]|nr:MAG: hypothetical protein C7N36_08305 [Bacteroidota bacterium]PTM11193.1 MAG: hypothetical protein DA408_14110 [Bacteroidota bacterium]